MSMYKMCEPRLSQTKRLVDFCFSAFKEKFPFGENLIIPMLSPCMVLSISKLTFSRCTPFKPVFLLADQKMQVSPWMDNGTADTYVKKHPSVDRLKILTDAASGKCIP
jgi:hypothetical protein